MNKTEVGLIFVVLVLLALFVANFTILFKIHDDQQIIKNKIDLMLTLFIKLIAAAITHGI